MGAALDGWLPFAAGALVLVAAALVVGGLARKRNPTWVHKHVRIRPSKDEQAGRLKLATNRRLEPKLVVVTTPQSQKPPAWWRSFEMTHGVALRTYLVGESDEDDVEVISQALDELGPARAKTYGIRRLSAEALTAVDDKVAAAIGKLLEYGLGGLLVEGWKEHSAFMDAAQRTSENLEQGEIVQLGGHTLTWTLPLKLDVLVNGIRAKTLEVVLTVAFEIGGLVAIVRKGWLVNVRSGDCVVSAALTFEDRPMLPKRETTIDLAILLPLRRPVRLLASGVRTDAG